MMVWADAVCWMQRGFVAGRWHTPGFGVVVCFAKISLASASMLTVAAVHGVALL